MAVFSSIYAEIAYSDPTDHPFRAKRGTSSIGIRTERGCPNFSWGYRQVWGFTSVLIFLFDRIVSVPGSGLPIASLPGLG